MLYNQQIITCNITSLNRTFFKFISTFPFIKNMHTYLKKTQSSELGDI